MSTDNVPIPSVGGNSESRIRTFPLQCIRGFDALN